MPTRYFKNSVDQYWYTTRNWWANAACDEGFSGTLTGVNVTDTSTTVTCDSTFGLVVGRPITGTGIDTGTTVASITDGTTFELSLPAIANGSSNLTCEKHENPATGDDVVIATGNGTVVGAPGYDVLGLVTVNGDTVLDLDGAINAANIEFNDTSSITDGGLTGTCVFNDSSFASIASSFSPITGNCTFNDSSYCAAYITGNCTFNNTSSNGGNSGGRSGYITGDCTFNDTSQNLAGTLTGTVTFNDSSYNGQYGYISGSAIFNDTSYNNASSGEITGNVSFNDTSYNNASSGEITGNVSFNDSSYNNSATVTVTGTLVFNDTSHNEAGFTANGTFNDTSYNNGAGVTGDCEFNDTSGNYGSITGNCTFNDSSHNEDTIVGDCVFNDTCHNNAAGDITGNCTFYDSSHNDGLVTGDCVFNDTSLNDYNTPGHVIGDATFNDSSYNRGTITGNATFTEAEYSYALTTVPNPQLGTVSGTVTFSSLTPVKFTLVSTDSWAGDTTGWVFDTAGQNWEFNDSSYNQGTITGNATVRQHAAAFVSWRDYATSTYVTGTLTLKFPEMDILGTGLL